MIGTNCKIFCISHLNQKGEIIAKMNFNCIILKQHYLRDGFVSIREILKSQHR